MTSLASDMSDVIINDWIFPIFSLLSPGLSAFCRSAISKMSHSGIAEEEFALQGHLAWKEGLEEGGKVSVKDSRMHHRGPPHFGYLLGLGTNSETHTSLISPGRGSLSPFPCKSLSLLLPFFLAYPRVVSRPLWALWALLPVPSRRQVSVSQQWGIHMSSKEQVISRSFNMISG